MPAARVARTLKVEARGEDRLIFKMDGLGIVASLRTEAHDRHVVRVYCDKSLRPECFFRKSDAFWYAVDRAMV